jgi:arginine exporter protein ArgO
LLRRPLPDAVSALFGSLQAFLLIVFAVSLENLFVQMLGFPGGFGRALRRRNRWLWLAALVSVAFLFFHTLINPRGELAEALQEGNVLVFLSVAAAFVAVAFLLRVVFRLRKRRTAAPQDSPKGS